MKHHFLYKTINLLNGRFYIGKHSTDNLDDGYMGSGKALANALEKYGRDNFKREIISFHQSSNEAYEYEKLLLTEEFLSEHSGIIYNLKRGGDGGFDHINKDPELHRLYNEKAQRARDAKSDEEKSIINAKKVLKGERNGMFGRDRSGSNNPAYGTKVSEDRKARQKESLRLYLINNPIKEESKVPVQCPHCGKEGTLINGKLAGGMNRWHFNNCRSRK